MSMHAAGGRIFGLDLLRACAILFVVYGHGITYTDPAVIRPDLYNVAILDGVTMFFVLSGFLIGRILLRMFARADLSFGLLLEFWVRRWFRTLPNYFLVLTLLVIFSYLAAWPQPGSLLLYYFFAQNIASPHPEFFQEAWSLSIEEWFYLSIPVLMFVSAKWKRFGWLRQLPFWIALIIIAVTAFRIYRAYHYNYPSFAAWDLGLRKQVVTRFDSLMFGVLGAYLSIYFTAFWQKAANKAFVAGLLLIVFDKVFYTVIHNPIYIQYFTLTLSAFATLLLLPKLSSMKRDHGWLVSIVTFVSVTSYSMYLLNFTPVQGVILPALMPLLTDIYAGFARHGYLVAYLLYWIITLTASWLLYRFFERPMTDLRDRFHPRGQVAVTAFAERETRSKS